MNIITSGCGNCMYCYNGQCSYGGQCYGSPQLMYVDGKWCWMPIGSFKENENIKKEIAFSKSPFNCDFWKSEAKRHQRWATIVERALNNAVRDRNYLAKEFYSFVVGECQLSADYYLKQAEEELAKEWKE